MPFYCRWICSSKENIRLGINGADFTHCLELLSRVAFILASSIIWIAHYPKCAITQSSPMIAGF